MDKAGQINTYGYVVSFDETGTMIDHNKAFSDLFAADTLVSADFYALMPEFQPDGRISQTFFKNQIKDAFNQPLGGKIPKFSWLFKRVDGRYFLANVALSKRSGPDGYSVACRILTTHEAAEDDNVNEERKINEQRMHVILDNIPAAVNFWDTEGNLMYCNNHIVKMLALPDKTDYLNNPHKYWPENQPNGLGSKEWSTELVKLAYETGTSEKLIWYFLDADGFEIPVDCSLYRVEWGDSYAILEFCRDLREEYKLQKEQQDSQKRLLAIINNLPAGIFISDEKMNILSHNSYMDAMLGLDECESISDFFEFLPETQSNGMNSVAAVNMMFATALEKGTVSTPFEAASRTGELLPLNCIVTRIPWGDGFAYMVFCHDMREHRSYEERLRLIVDNMPLAVNFRDENFHLVDSNQAARDLFEVSSTEEYSERILEFSPEYQPCGSPSKEMAKEHIAMAHEKGSVTFCWMNQKADGTPIPTEITLIPVQWLGRTMICTFLRDMREVIKSQNEQKVARERVLAMVNASPMMCFICDANLNVLDCNDRVPALLNWDSKQTFIDSYMHFFPITQPDGRDSHEVVKEYLTNAFNGDNTTFEWTFQRADGKPLPAEVSATLTELDDQEVLIVYCRDLREVIKSQSEQKAARERILAMINASPLMCYVCDTDYNIIDCNDISPKLLGLDSKQEFLDSFRNLHPRNQPCGRTSIEAANDYLGQALEEGSNVFEWWFRKPDKELLPVESSASCVELDGQQLLIVYSRDLRESIKYEQEQKAARERVLAMVNASPMMCFVCDSDLNVLDCNDRVPTLLNWDSKQTFIDSMASFLPRTQPDGRDSYTAIREYLSSAFDSGSTTFEWNFLRADAELLPVEVRTTLTELDGKKVLIVYCRDMRDHYRYMQEQRVLSERMEAIINAAPMVCFVMNRKLDVVDCNLSGEEFFGVGSYAELDAMFSQLHPEQQPDGSASYEKIMGLFERAFSTESETFEWVHRSMRGEELPVEVHVRKVLVDDKGYCIVYLRDLRESIKFNEERRVARERIVAMLDASPLACSILDDDFNILICNESVVELFGLKDKDEYISNFLQLHPQSQPDGRDSKEKLKENIERAFVGGSSEMTFEWMFQTLTGDLVPSEMTLKPVTLDDKNLMIAYIQDLRHIKQAALAAEALEKLAYTDSLTGASNRRYFEDMAEQELKNSIANGNPFTLIMLDIDDFKAVNDSFGHVVGDGVLKILVSRMRHTLRKNVIVARYGGEEFVVMMPGISEESAERTAWRIRKNIEGSKFLVDGVKVPITVSMGVASRSHGSNEELTDIIMKADKALYEAKASGKNTVVLYDESMSQKFVDAKERYEKMKGRNS